MKKTWIFIAMLICTVAATVAFSATAFAAKTAGTAYYVSSSTGNDNNDGKSELTPWKTLIRVNATVFSPGDSILLKTGDTWEEELILHGNGAVGDTLLPITLSSYGNEGRPIIAPGGTDRTCLTINGLEGWEIRGLELCNAYQGILISYHDVFEKDYLSISDCYIHNINREFNSNPQENGRYKYNHFSSGIAIRGWMAGDNGYIPGAINLPLEEPPVGSIHLSRLLIDSVEFEDCDAGIWMCKDDIANTAQMGYFSEASFSNLTFRYCGMWGYSLKNLYNSTVYNCDCFDSGTVPVWCGSCSGLVESCIKVTLDGCDIYCANRDPAQSYDGCGFDFEAWNYDVTYKNAVIDGTDGCGIFVFDNGLGNINDKLAITGCTIKSSGLNCGNTCANVDFTAKIGSNGGIFANNNLYCTNEKSLYVGGCTDGWTFSGNTYQYCESIPIWNFNDSICGWNTTHNIFCVQNPQTISLSITGMDPYILCGNQLNIDSSQFSNAILKMKNNTSNTTAKLYWITSNDLAWDEDKSATISIVPYDSIFRPYYINLTENTHWDGTIIALRIDPVDNISSSTSSATCDVEIDSFRLATSPNATLHSDERKGADEIPVSSNPIIWDFSKTGDAIGWSAGNSVAVTARPEGLNVATSGIDPYIVSPENLNYSANVYNTVRITIENRSDETKAALYWITNEDMCWNADKSAVIDLLPETAGVQEYTLYLRSNIKWAGILYQLRLDTMETLSGASSGAILIKSIVIDECEIANPCWGINAPGLFEKWISGNHVFCAMKDGHFEVSITGADPYIFSPDNLGINMNALPYIEITMKNASLDWAGKVYWTTTSESNWNEEKSCSFTLKNADDIYRTYIVNVGACNSWTGTLKQLRLDIVDNVSSGVVSINEIRLTAHPGENYASWTFSGENNSDGWQLINHVRGNAAGGSLNLGIAGSDPYIYSPDYLNLNLDHCRYIRIDMANATYATEGRVYWTTTQDTNWSEDKSAAFTILTGRQDLNSYIIDFGYNVNWKGILKQIRLDFVDQLTAGNVNIDAVYIY